MSKEDAIEVMAVVIEPLPGPESAQAHQVHFQVADADRLRLPGRAAP